MVFSLFLAVFLELNLPRALAQSLDIAYVYNVTDTQAKNGDILIMAKDKGLIRTDIPLDNRIFGILQTTPVLTYRPAQTTDQPVMRNGVAQVNISTINGPIAIGDYITSSEVPGKGEKADKSGYVVGVALEPFTETQGEKIDFQRTFSTDKSKASQNQTIKISTGTISVALKTEYAELTTARSALRMFDSFNAMFYKNVQDPEKFTQIFRYIAAAITVLISLGVGFLSFSRSIPKAIEAIGRNPLAKQTIIFSIILNIGFTLGVALVGILAAVFILRL